MPGFPGFLGRVGTLHTMHQGVPCELLILTECEMTPGVQAGMLGAYEHPRENGIVTHHVIFTMILCCPRYNMLH